ncbi:transient receptor potential channel pyrexia [Wyeomyia smithii]|uniref:transient receptor potential channel pyrexia n=1 Tax=Wyeomyia smithii TaxID=174621 RepID=UPI002467F2DE|nr:transient receptor potential channel pyrexia [Wyeomyia smithii]XP_055544905.1 transient receptor potential channel pyrexia [Wyeomyia smithii]XP_055544911.1 transient receptor potential channel pyrexia [Wyeomyia smithii]XP_055544918.1 transient receptor potential channel pyrexia [Wyeomyia smithii]XP_055544925.1 transient receptor potential channel pyrexia [Wyeomyia smithii]XP_055544934.1 transient receptor potential channel pyrexia [Wyeomyia smithii]XP_055544941.1 transient receptor potenti
MEVVRFSIIEDQMKWKDECHVYCQDVDDEEGAPDTSYERPKSIPDGRYRHSISSESDVAGVEITSPNQPNDLCSSSREGQDEIWAFSEIEASLKRLPDAEKIGELLDSHVPLENILREHRYDNGSMLLLAVWASKHNVLQKLLALTDRKVDVNAADLSGRTALHIACYVGDYRAVDILLQHGAKTQLWDKDQKATPLHCAASCGSVECIARLIEKGADINAGIENHSPLHYAVQRNSRKCVELLLTNGANPNTPQVYTQTPLHVAASNGFVDIMKLLLDHGADARSQYGKKKITALHLASSENYLECVELLITAGADIDARNQDQQTPLHLACLSQCHETVTYLIEQKADVHAVYRDGRTALHASIVKESRFWDCTLSLLKAKVDVNRADNFGYTPLHIAALNEFSSCAFMLIEYGADLTARTNGGVSALSFIIRRTPEIIPKFIGKLDAAISVNSINEIGDVDCEIRLDFRPLVPNNDRGETELLLAFIDVGQRRILKHPLCETFLLLKWRRIRKFFLFSLFYHGLFVLLFTVFVLGVYVKKCQGGMQTCQTEAYVPVIGYVVIFLNLLLISKEIFQIMHWFLGYIRYWENWLELATGTGIFLCTFNPTIEISSHPTWQHHLAAIVIFLAWLELMMLVGRFPIFGLYVQMFTTVAVNFSKFLMAYCCLLVAFGLSFRVLFSDYKANNDIWASLLKTIVMMAGELEFEDMFYNDDVQIKYPGTAHVMFLAFVLLVTVILTNLLVGLAVSDIQGLQQSAGLDRLSRQAELISRLEGLMFSKILRKVPISLWAIFQEIALLKTSPLRLHFRVKPNDPREKRIPKELITSIYKLVAERRERTQSMKRKRTHRNLQTFEERLEEDDSVTLRRKRFQNHHKNRTVSENPYLLKTARAPDQTIGSKPISVHEPQWKSFADGQKQILKKLDDMSQEIDVLKAKIKSS